MGDTEKGSWTSRELGRHINEEQVRAAERVGHTPGPARVSAWPLVRAGICAAFAGIVLAILVVLAFCLQGRP